MQRLPSLFISHGAPDLPIRTGPTQDFLRRLATELPRPKAILAVSAHWETPYPMVSAAPQPKTIHDFNGFPEALYRLRYPAPGAPELARQVSQRLVDAGFQADIHPSRGLDHGAWNPLLLVYPEADIPVTQLSIQPYLGPAHHLRVGQVLAPLRDEGVLIFASGAVTHNLGALDGQDNTSPADWAMVFDRWLAEAIALSSTERLLDYRALAPHAALSHPTDEHLLPLFVALGAGGEQAKGQQIHQGYTYGSLSMAAYAFN
ncbi:MULTISPECIES: class III extradiol ring-cleavage dioxygenase [unclassified Leptolyngbya]|uniref:DODA-type extradiol aromatic ring-opening family dioxygenase n=1 Tax=unclassified Leptolyngbya TaxID=2650499 RepID=UPI0016865E96|nr:MULTISPECIES: class III extradiol ring-cleavage dioxygenase [unclassified Leptolyngbya]MBD1910455.1 dioxygenase [Leptolyngbya sp. FACHB-8]MBD2156762.1 dioxygenase [Leptolyngbya sp. FACHB-16]